MEAHYGPAALALAAALLLGCERDPKPAPTNPSAQVGPGEITAELAQKQLAQVGTRSITLGDYAATLERMDQFERLRYQTPERRKQLLDELINSELLAREAERRGLHQNAETQELLRQLLRDELLRRERDKMPKLEALPVAKLREYYDAHRSELGEPERRRVGHIVMKSRAQAEQVLAMAKGATPAQWGALVGSHSLEALRPAPVGADAAPLELAGDLGLVSAPGSERGENPGIAEPLRAAVFKINTVGEVFDGVVENEGKFHIVRLMGISAARERSFEEAERTIRVRVLQEMIEQSERQLLAELRQSIPVTINEAALQRVKPPAPAP